MENDRPSIEYIVPEIIAQEDLWDSSASEVSLRRGSIIEAVHCSDNSYTRRMLEVERIQQLMIEYEKKKRRWKWLSIFCIK